jgi:hypothetical protein
VRVPSDLLVEADRIAAQLGEDRAVVLGDLVAAAIPGALADAAEDLVGRPARERLAGHRPYDDVLRDDDPGPLPGAVRDLTDQSDSPLAIVAGPAVQPRSSDGTAS